MADVRIVHEDGRFGVVDSAKLGDAAKLGWRPETDTDQAERQRGTLVETAGRGAVEGVVGGALALPKLAEAAAPYVLPSSVMKGARSVLGTDRPFANLSGRQFVEDAAAVAAHLRGGESEVAGREMREQIHSDTVANPLTALGSELAGTVVGAGALGRVASGVGAAAGEGLSALGAGARAARAGGLVAGAVTEGAGLGANAASESAWLRNETATAEQTLAGVGLGALFGGVTAGAVAGGGAGLSRLLRRAPAAAEGLEGAAARVGREAAEDAALGEAGGVAAGEAAQAESVVGSRAARVPSPVEEAASSGTGRKARAWLSDAGDEGIVDAISRGNKRALKDLGYGEAPTAARKRATGALIHDLGIAGVGRSESAMLDVAEQRVGEMGRRIGKAVEAADARVLSQEGGMLAPQSIEAVFPKIEALKTKLSEGAMLPEERALAGYVEDTTQYLRDKAATGELLPSELQKFRIKVDELGKWLRADPGPKGDAARELRKVLEGHLQEEIAKAGPDLAQDYARAKELYGAASWARDTLMERVGVRNGANRMFSPSDYGTAGAALLAGGNPVTAALAGLANKAVRERAYSTFAVLAKKAAGDAVDVAAAPAGAVRTARNVQSLVAHSEQRMGEGIGRFFGGSGSQAATSGRGARASTSLALRSSNLAEAQRAYRDHAREVQTVAAVPEVAASRLAGITGQELPTVAPGLHAAMAAVATRGAQYLASNMPAPPIDPDSVTPHLDTPPPVSSADLARYADRVDGVANPLSLVDDLAHGNVSPDKVDAVKTVYPTLFDRIREHVFSQLAQRTEPVPYHQRLLLDLALDGNGALEPSLKPSSLAVMKAANLAAAKAAAPPSASGKVPHIAGMFTTRSAQITAPRGA